jgi:hypothetical protein
VLEKILKAGVTEAKKTWPVTASSSTIQPAG